MAPAPAPAPAPAAVCRHKISCAWWRLTQPQRLRAQLRYPQPSAHTPPTPELNDQRLRAQLRYPQPSAHTPPWSPAAVARLTRR